MISNPTHATLVSLCSGEREEIIHLTGGLKAKLFPSEELKVFPYLSSNKLEWSEPIPARLFSEWISRHGIRIIGVKTESDVPTLGTIWDWHLVRSEHDLPGENPSHCWREVASGAERHSIGNENDHGVFPTKLDKDVIPVKALSACARHIQISLHQLNMAIINLSEHLHGSLCSHLEQVGGEEARHWTTNELDVVSYVHSFFQAFSAARDHYARFLAISMSRPRVKEVGTIDTLFKLLNSTDPDELRKLPILREFEKAGLIRVGAGKHPFKGQDRFSVVEDCWLGFLNSMRNRFTHKEPYGSLGDENLREIYRSQTDDTVFMAKSFIRTSRTDTNLDLLKTLDYSYQKLCKTFQYASNVTELKKDPPVLNFTIPTK